MMKKAGFHPMLWLGLVGGTLAVLGSCAYFGRTEHRSEVESPAPTAVQEEPVRPKPVRPPLAAGDIEGKPRKGTFGALEVKP